MSSDTNWKKYARQFQGLEDAGLTVNESATVFALAVKLDLTPTQVVRQALRLYQLHAEGLVTVKDHGPPEARPAFRDSGNQGATMTDFWCARCGVTHVPLRSQSCETCQFLVSLDDIPCQTCRKPSVVGNVNGFRCREHENEIFGDSRLSGTPETPHFVPEIPEREIAKNRDA